MKQKISKIPVKIGNSDAFHDPKIHSARDKGKTEELGNIAGTVNLAGRRKTNTNTSMAKNLSAKSVKNFLLSRVVSSTCKSAFNHLSFKTLSSDGISSSFWSFV